MKHQLALPWSTHSHNPLPELGLAEHVTHNAPRHLAATATLFPVKGNQMVSDSWHFSALMWSVSLASEHMPSSQVALETALRVFLQISTQTANTPFTGKSDPSMEPKVSARSFCCPGDKEASLKDLFHPLVLLQPLSAQLLINVHEERLMEATQLNAHSQTW